MNRIYAWVGSHVTGLFIAALITSFAFSMYSLVDITRKPAELKDFKGGIQNHLLWSNKGECFFVRPYNNETVYLIRVEDCDKK